MKHPKPSVPSILHRPSLSSLELQMSLYYNSLYSLIFVVLIAACAVDKLLYYNKRVCISVVCIWALLELVRLSFGYRGNLKENVSDLTTFLLITLFPQTPFMLYFGYIQPIIFPVDPVLATLMLAFLVFEFIHGLSLLRLIIRSQTAQFMRLCEVEEEHEE